MTPVPSAPDEPRSAVARLPWPTARAAVAVVARLVPAGRVVAYGDIGALLGLAPRAVGRAMATHEKNGERDVSWWRVTNAAGELPAHLQDEARARWLQEGTPLRAGGRGVDIQAARADLPALADAAETLLGPLPGSE